MRAARLSTLLGLVAVAGLLVGGWALRERSRACGLRALRHEVIADLLRTRGACEAGLGGPATARRVGYHRSLAEKYRRAASRPWLAIEPDPPPPPGPTPEEVAAGRARLDAIAVEALALDRARRAAAPGR